MSIFQKDTHPIQPIVVVEGIHRFKKNNIVRFLLDRFLVDGGGLNKLYSMYHDTNPHGFTQDDFIQLNQLIGYSVGGFCDLSIVPDEYKDLALNISDNITKGIDPDENVVLKDSLHEQIAKVKFLEVIIKNIRDQIDEIL